METVRLVASPLATAQLAQPYQAREHTFAQKSVERAITCVEVVADLLTVVLAVMTSYWVYTALHFGKQIYYNPLYVLMAAGAFAVLQVLLLYRENAYAPAISLLRIRETERILRTSIHAFGSVFLISFFTVQHFSRYVLIGAILTAPFFLILEKQIVWRGIRSLRKRGVGVQNVIIYGAGNTGRRVFSAIARSPKLGLRPAVMIDDDQNLDGQTVYEYGYRREQSLKVVADSLSRNLVRQYDAQLVIVGIPSLSRQRLEEIAAQASNCGCATAFVSDTFCNSDVRTEYADLDGLLVASWKTTSGKPGYEMAKRAFDFTVALVLILLTAPAWIVLGLLVRLDSKGPIFFHQTRIGRNGKPFTLFKFRSMKVDAPKYGFHPNSSQDSRVTRVGRWLRRTSLDELPQLFNVLFGHMSLVGPRPEMPFIVEKYGQHERQRLAVTPGITGLWQLSADRAFLIHENLQYDLYYIRNRNFFMDVALLLHTAMFAMRGV